MKKINKLIGLFFILISFITLASCSSGAGVKAIMEAKAGSNKITITCTFEANSKLESGEAYPLIRRYSYENGEVKSSSDDYKKITFGTSATVASVEFDGLQSDTKYLFKLYVNYDSSDTYIDQIEVTTLSESGEKTISNKEEFESMTDNSDGVYTLTSDIDFGGEELSLFNSDADPFKGTFDGNGHTISNFKLAKTSYSYFGLFGYTKNATISNLNIENVVVESTNLNSFSAGVLVGKAESTVVSNVKISGVEATVNVSSSGDINLGGVVGSATGSTFTETEVKDINIHFTQIRYKVNVGLFAGKISGASAVKRTVDGREKSVITDACSAVGELTGNIKFTSSTEGYLRAGGFVGFVEAASSLIYNSYCSANINITKSEATNKYDLSIGGFVGSNNGYINIEKCFAKTNIKLSAGSEVTSETSPEDIASIQDTLLVADKSSNTASVGGFAGRLYRTVGTFKDIYFLGDVNVYAKATRNASEAERTKFETAIDGKISESAVGTSKIVDGILYEITAETLYYTYDSENGTYILATDVDPDKFSPDKYYTKSGEEYIKAESYTPKVLTATYLITGEVYGYTAYIDAAGQTTELDAKLSNVDKYQSTSDTSMFADYVKNFVNTIIL